MRALLVKLVRVPAFAPFVLAWRETGDPAALLVLTDYLEEYGGGEWHAAAIEIRKSLQS